MKLYRDATIIRIAAYWYVRGVATMSTLVPPEVSEVEAQAFAAWYVKHVKDYSTHGEDPWEIDDAFQEWAANVDPMAELIG